MAGELGPVENIPMMPIGPVEVLVPEKLRDLKPEIEYIEVGQFDLRLVSEIVAQAKEQLVVGGVLELTEIADRYKMSPEQAKTIQSGWEWCRQISAHVNHEETMMHPTEDILLGSYLTGMAVICTIPVHTQIDDNAVDGVANREAVGFCRLLPSVSSERLSGMGVVMDGGEVPPDVMELGTVIVAERHRGKGIGKYMSAYIHMQFAAQLRSRELLIIGTTTTQSMIAALRGAKDAGIWYKTAKHNIGPWQKLAAATCTCNDHVKVKDIKGISTGMHIQEECVMRTDNEKFDVPVRVDDEKIFDYFVKSCHMFVSDSDLAAKLNQAIIEAAKPWGWNLQTLAKYLQGINELPNN